MNTRAWTCVLAMVVLISGCSGGFSLNPFNWFRSGPEVETLSELDVQTVTDSRPLIQTVTSLSIDRTPGGAIVRATGLPSVQGWHSADLVAENDGDPINGILTYAFRAAPPEIAERSSTVQSRELVVGKFIPELTLVNVREIRVVGQTNIRSARR